MSAASASPQTAMKRLAGALSFVCLVLFLLAIEQKQTVAAWEGLRDGAGPAVRGVADWAGRLPPRVAEGFQGLRSAVARQTAVWSESRAAASGANDVLKGEGGPASETAPAAAGSLTLVRAELRFGNGEILHTRPLRIARGRDAFAPGRTFSARLDAPADAQIELREVVAPVQGQAPPGTSLCAGEPAGVAALLHRRDRIDLMLFRSSTVGPDTPPAAVCGVWTFPAR